MSVLRVSMLTIKRAVTLNYAQLQTRNFKLETNDECHTPCKISFYVVDVFLVDVYGQSMTDQNIAES